MNDQLVVVIQDGEACWGLVHASATPRRYSGRAAVMILSSEDLERQTDLPVLQLPHCSTCEPNQDYWCYWDEVDQGDHSLSSVRTLFADSHVPVNSSSTQLQAAGEIQRGLLPTSDLDIPDYEFSKHYIPTDVVGGDFCQHFGNRDQSQVVLALGEACGHGMPAALLKCALSSELLAYLKLGVEVEEIANRINSTLCEYGKNRFATLMLAALDYERHEVTLVNAGHLHPLLRKSGGEVAVVDVECTGLPLGINPELQYETFRVGLEVGENLLFFSSGVVESANESGEFYCQSRLQDAFSPCSEGPRKTVEVILKDLGSFTRNRCQLDDVSILCLRRVN